MDLLYLTVAFILLLSLGAGLIRVVRGPTDGDRMLSAQLVGTIAVAILLLLAELSGQESLRDVALVLALLAAVTAAAYTRHDPGGEE